MTKVPPQETADRPLRVTRIAVALGTLLLAIFVALSPRTEYALVPKVVLFLLVALLPALLFAAEATAQFNLNLGWFVASASGAAALALITLVLLTHLAKPEQQIAVFEIVDERDQPIAGLDRNDAVSIPLPSNATPAEHFIRDNSVLVVFPEQTPTVDLLIRPIAHGTVYRGSISYAGYRRTRLVLGRDLVASR